MPYDNIISRSDAGALIPEEVSSQIFQDLPKQSVALSLFKQVKMSSKQQKMPVLSVLPTAYFVNGDSGIKQTTEVNWADKQLEAEEVACIVPIPEAVLDDSAFDVWEEIKPRLVEAIGRTIDAAVLFGANKPISWATSIFDAATAANNTFDSGSLSTQKIDVDVSSVMEKVEADGFMVNGFSQVGSADNVVYYDDPRFCDFWRTAAALGKPFYLHPRDPLPSREPIYDGFPWLTAATWAFAVETSIHALRLMSSGLFDRHPTLQMILGHLGEGIPFNIWRVDHIVRKAPRGIPCKRSIGEYLRENVYITTSGNFRTPSLISTMLEVGSDRIMYSVDYPFETHEEASRWFDSCEISENDRRKIGRDNARRLFGLR